MSVASFRDRRNWLQFIKLWKVTARQVRGPADEAERRRFEREGKRDWLSRGEVRSPNAIRPRSGEIVDHGLFCERIFGPVIHLECRCAKYRGPSFQGTVCERCGVEVAHTEERRRRMGHVELAAPMVHTALVDQFFTVLPTVFDIDRRDLRNMIDNWSYLVVDSGEQDASTNQVLDPEQYDELNRRAQYSGDQQFAAFTGARAIAEFFRRSDIPSFVDDLTRQMEWETRKRHHARLTRRLEAVQVLIGTLGSNESRSWGDWVSLEAIPVIPPDQRPFRDVDGGGEGTSGLNRLYSRLIGSNNRLARAIWTRESDTLVHAKKRDLQDCIDALLTPPHRGGRKGPTMPVIVPTRRPPRSRMVTNHDFGEHTCRRCGIWELEVLSGNSDADEWMPVITTDCAPIAEADRARRRRGRFLL